MRKIVDLPPVWVTFEHRHENKSCSASGEMVPPRLVFKGVRNDAEEKLKNLDKSGDSGAWTFSVSPKGYITRDLFAEVLHDLDTFLHDLLQLKVLHNLLLWKVIRVIRVTVEGGGWITKLESLESLESLKWVSLVIKLSEIQPKK